jgi:hypothetical protein
MLDDRIVEAEELLVPELHHDRGREELRGAGHEVRTVPVVQPFEPGRLDADRERRDVLPPAEAAREPFEACLVHTRTDPIEAAARYRRRTIELDGDHDRSNLHGPPRPVSLRG